MRRSSICWSIFSERQHFGFTDVFTGSRGTVQGADPAIAIVNPLRFPGQYFDQEVGTHYNFHRDYEPQTGRYVQTDPIGLLGGLNLTAYAMASPTVLVDPHGLDPYMTCAMTGDCTNFPGDPNNPDDWVPSNRLDSFLGMTARGAAEALEIVCDGIKTVLKCTATCAFKEFIFDSSQIVESTAELHRDAVMLALQRSADETASKALRRGVPIANLGFFLKDARGTIHCTVDCF